MAGEVDRIEINSSVGDVVSLSVSASDGTYPLVRLIDSDGNILARSVAYDQDSASTYGYRSKGELLLADVYAQSSFTGNYSLEVEKYAIDSPSLSFPQDLLIILDQD